MPNQSRICRLLAALAMLTLPSAWGASACAAVPWHPDLAAACRASEISQRPILAIFTASWSSASTTLDRTTLASDEAVALITACFEPVCVDVDTTPEATRRLGITKVPTACILAADEQLLTKFELPETPAGFVAAAARGLQQAAATSTARASSIGMPRDAVAGVRDVADMADSGTGALPPFGNEANRTIRATTTAAVHGTVPPGGRSIHAIAAKVRRLSDFASDDTASPTAQESAIAASFRDSGGPIPTSQPSSAAPLASSEHTAWLMPPATASTMPEMARPTSVIADSTVQDAKPVGMVSPLDATPASGMAAASAPQRPLSIEPGPMVQAETTSNQIARSAPWLGLPPQNQPTANSTPPSQQASHAPLSQPSASSPASTTQTFPTQASATRAFPTQAFPNQAFPNQAFPTQGDQPAPNPPVPSQGGASAAPSTAALAESKPKAKPASAPESGLPKPSAASSLLSTLQKPFSMFSSSGIMSGGKSGASKSGTKGGSLNDEKVPSTTLAAGSTSTAASQGGGTAVSSTESDPYGSMPLGLEGYCPVTLAERGAWVEGRAQWGARHRGRTYLFASAEQQKAFLSDPDRYAPALSGDDPVLAFDSGKSTPGQRRYGVTYQARTYLFSSTETRDAFAANPQRYTSGTMVAEHVGPVGGQVLR